LAENTIFLEDKVPAMGNHLSAHIGAESGRKKKKRVLKDYYTDALDKFLMIKKVQKTDCHGDIKGRIPIQ